MFTRHKLSNGLHVLFAPLRETKAITVLMMTKVGSRYETAANNGVSHFLEHMMFKGTEKRPTARDVSKELDGVGADFNAFTGKDYTGYYIKLAHEHIDLALDIIADMLWHSKFSPEEIDKERKVIMEEINMYYDNPIMLVEDLFEERMFGKQHPLGRLISGPKSVISTMRRSAILRYFHRHYFPSNMVLCVAGRFPEGRTLRVVKDLFGSVNHRRPPTVFRPFREYQTRPQVELLHRETEQVQLALGFPGLPYGHSDLAALGVLAVILGGNMSSRLFTRIREQEGLAYAIHASRNAYEDTGTFIVRAGLDKTRLLPAIEHIIRELRDVRKNGVTEQEVQQAKEFVRGKLVLDLEDSEEIANFYTKQALLIGTIQTPAQRLAQVERVQVTDVQRVAQALFVKKKLTLALIGPFRDASVFTRFLAKTE